MRPLSNYALCLSVVAILAVAVGCNRHPNQSKVEGTITYKSKPLSGAHLMFINKSGRPGFADVDETGHFVAFTYAPGDGLLIGDTVVTITPHFSTPAPGKSGRGEGKGDAAAEQFQRWPDRYLQADTSPLKIKVEPGKVNTVELVVED